MSAPETAGADRATRVRTVGERSRVLVTGASGFIGRHVVAALAEEPSCSVIGLLRRHSSPPTDHIELVRIDDLGPSSDLRDVLDGIDIVIHTAAHVHSRQTAGLDSSEHKRINTLGSINLAEQAAGAGVRRFVYLSSIKVHGEHTPPGKSFRPDDEPHPVGPYAISKLEAEIGLRRVGEISGMEWVVVRPPLVYGSGVGANFLTLMRWIDRGLPLPLAGITNKRSFVAIENLVSLIRIVISDPVAANRTFLISDGADISTSDLLIMLGKYLDRPARLFRMPRRVLEICATLGGRREELRRLLQDLCIDLRATCSVLDWRPVISMEEALRNTVRHYRETAR